MKNKRHCLRMEIKQISDAGSFDGVLATYNTVDLGNDLIEPGAFSKTIQEHGPEVKLLWQHEPGNVIGKLYLMDGPDALRVRGQIELDPDIPYSMTAYKLLKKRLLSGLSIGYDTIKEQMDGGIRHLKELRLWEGSIVTFPMNELAGVTSVKNKPGLERKDDFNTELAEAQILAAGDMMRCALFESLNDMLYDPELSRDDKIAGSQLSIEQFSEAYMAWLPQYLDWLASVLSGATDDDGMEMMRRAGLEAKIRIPFARKEGRRFSASTMSSLMEGHAHAKALDQMFTALFNVEAAVDSEDDSEEDDTSDEKAAVPVTEPVPDHSAAKILVSEIRSLIPAA